MELEGDLRGWRVPTMNSAIPRVLEHYKKGVSFREWS
jgi:hypothetical protein